MEESSLEARMQTSGLLSPPAEQRYTRESITGGVLVLVLFPKELTVVVVVTNWWCGWVHRILQQSHISVTEVRFAVGKESLGPADNKNIDAFLPNERKISLG